MLALGLSLCVLGRQAAMGQTVAGASPNADPERLRAIVHNVILGQVIQRATGQSMKELYDKNIFGPMGMKSTQFPVNQEISSPVLHAFTMDRKLYEDCTYWNPFWGSTPGLPTSNIHDLGKWARSSETGRLISPAHFREQIAPTSVGKGKNRT